MKGSTTVRPSATTLIDSCSRWRAAVLPAFRGSRITLEERERSCAAGRGWIALHGVCPRPAAPSMYELPFDGRLSPAGR
jgi:hypothetical protein